VTDPSPHCRSLGAAELARRIATRELASAEVVEAFIQRIEAVNPELNAVVVERFEAAREEAAEADRVLAEGRADGAPVGPLHGVPITLKESHFLAGTPSTGGLPDRKDHRAPADGPLVRRLRDAGAIVLGKTNLPELLLYLESDNPVYGRTNNPWDPARSPGGSSGGEGAIVGAGASPLGLGTDIGGSIRVPSHACGVHGLKPTTGRLTMIGTYDAELFPGQRAVIGMPGPIARRVEDLTLAMRVLLGGGPEMALPTYPLVPLGDPGEVPIEGLRVAWFDDDGFIRPAPAIRRAVREAVAALEARGAIVEEWRPPDMAEAMELYFSLLAADGAAWAREALSSPGKHDRRIRDMGRLAGMPRPLRPLVAGALRLAGQKRLARQTKTLRRRSASAFWRLVKRKEEYMARFLGGLDGHPPEEGEVAGWWDVIVCPPSAHPAVTHGASYYLGGVASYTMLFNLLGVPAGVVAATRVREGEESDRPRSLDLVDRTARKVERGSVGLPVGVQVAARHWRDEVVLAVMGALEEAFRGVDDYPIIEG
jgi:fatty acid amide hydrolase